MALHVCAGPVELPYNAQYGHKIEGQIIIQEQLVLNY